MLQVQYNTLKGIICLMCHNYSKNCALKSTYLVNEIPKYVLNLGIGYVFKLGTA